MSWFSRFPATRWLAPAVAVVAVVGGAFGVRAVVDAGIATQAAALPSVTAQQLIADVAAAQVTGLSGTVVQSADLGLPDLPGLGMGGGAGSGLAGLSGSSGTSWTSLISGSHTLRVWYGGPSKVRLALIGSLGESDLIRDGSELWLWSSADNSADHIDLPTDHADAGGDAKSPPAVLPSGAAGLASITPQQLAQRILTAAGPSTAITLGTSDAVAGRPTYELVATPKDKNTLVDRIQVAIDGTTHVPLRVQVFSTQIADPAFEVGFTSVDFATPPASEFAFTPPPGARVHQGVDLGSLGGHVAQRCGGSADLSTVPTSSGASGWTSYSGTPSAQGSGAAYGSWSWPGSPANGMNPAGALGPVAPKVVGSGWSAVVVGNLLSATGADPGCADTSSLSGNLASIMGALPTVGGSWGTGHLLSGTLFSVVVTDSGTIAAGAVPPATLYAALAAK